MFSDFEAGYTPANLRLALQRLGMTQAALASILGFNERQVRRWLVEDLSEKKHADMPLIEWRKVIKMLKNSKNED